MRVRFGFGWQIALVTALFAASLAALLSSNLAALWLPTRETEIQKQLTGASRRMAETAAPLLEEWPAAPRQKPAAEWHSRLSDITREALADTPGAEGGFYLAGDREGFIGYAFPNDPHAPPQPPPSGEHPPPPGPLPPHDPPPKERPLILAQVRASLTLEPDAPPIVQIREVFPSRVLVVTEPVGRQRPARLATWVMIRLTGPEQLAEELRHYQTATGFALVGILFALVLTANLGRNLRQERRQREQLREELRRSEHLAALGKLLAGVAHEVRNPLAAIRSTAQLWQRLPEQARNPSALEAILHAVDRLNALVSRLLFFVRNAYDEHRSINVNAVVEETLTLLRAQAQAQGIALQTELAADLPRISGSAQALQQVVLNLASNALQAMPSGGTFCCRTRALDAPSRVELCVADTGPGIAPTEQAHLFEPFYTTRPEGTGLGLALCREIVQQHGGQIELDRREGWGAVFRVTLPLAATERKTP